MVELPPRLGTSYDVCSSPRRAGAERGRIGALSHEPALGRLGIRDVRMWQIGGMMDGCG